MARRLFTGRVLASHLERFLAWNNLNTELHYGYRSFSSRSNYSSNQIRTEIQSNSRVKLSVGRLESNVRAFSSSPRCYSEKDDKNKAENNLMKVLGVPPTEPYAGGYRNPLNVFHNEMKVLKGDLDSEALQEVPSHSDVVIIGGGVIGMATAYWLKQKAPRGFDVTVIERDPSYKMAATSLNVGGLRQQFSLEENIQMSLFGAEFLREITQHLRVLDFDPPDVCFTPQGYLFLASKEGAECLRQNHATQCALGAKVDLLNVEQLKDRFKWLNTSGIELGTYGIQNEGWLDPWLLLCALKAKAASLGAKFITGEVVGFTTAQHEVPLVLPGSTFGVTEARIVEGRQVKRDVLRNVHVQVGNGKVYPIQFAMVANCAGPWARDVARLAGIGVGDDILSVDLPVEPRKRYVYTFHCKDGPGLETPMIVDSSGVYVRREGLGGNYICGASPPNENAEPDTADLSVDYEFFDEVVWPRLAERVPAFENLKLKSAWAGYYDYNYHDQNLIIGNHPYHRNFFMAVGSSGHGMQHSPAIGRALMECMTEDEYQTINLSRFCFDRILDDVKLKESEII